MNGPQPDPTPHPDAGVGADIRIAAGNPTPAEVAAVTAVLNAAIEELAGRERRTNGGPDGWQRSRRPMRRPLVHGAWRSFGA